MHRFNYLYVAFFVFSFLFGTQVSAQSFLQGDVKDSFGKNLPSVSVTYGEKGKSNILGFAITNESGKFQIVLKQSVSDSLWLRASHINFQPVTVIVAGKQGTYALYLSEKTDRLKEITIKGTRPISSIGDTINYDVLSFSAAQDRTIGDIIKKLPGVEMQGDQILYNGKPLQRFTINQLNLMGGRYGIINQSLPHDVVSKVQIIENDQPVKVLDSVMPSDRASLNLVLKKNNVTSGSGRIGLGAAPLLWNANLTPITLMSRWQMLNTIEANNTGSSLLNRMDILTSEDNPENNVTQKFLNLQSTGNPPFDENKWLDNDAKLLSNSFTFKDKKNVEWRSNASYVNQFAKNQGSSVTNYLTPEQNIIVWDNISNRHHVDDLKASLAAEKNEKSFYLKESVYLGKKWENASGSDIRNDDFSIDQSLNIQSFFMANKLNVVTKLGKQLVTMSSDISYGERPQFLNVVPGQFIGILNGGEPYANAFQTLQHKAFHTTNSIGFVKGLRLFTLNINAGFSLDQNVLESNLLIDGKTSGNNFMNNVRFLSPRLFGNPSLQVERNNIRISVSLLVQWQQFRADYDRIKTDSTITSGLTANPSLNIRYSVNPLLELYAGGDYTNNFGNLIDLYQSFILTSFSELNRSGSYQMARGNMLSGNFSANYKNVLKARFANIVFHYSKNRSDYISQVLLDDIGLTTHQLLPKNNGGYSVGSSANFSQYFNKLKTTVQFTGRWNRSVYDQLVNNVFAPYTSEIYGGKIVINSAVYKWATILYSGSLDFFKNYYATRRLNNLKNQVHHMEVNVFPKKNHMVSSYTDYYISNLRGQNNQVFLSLKYTVSVPKHKLDFSLSCNNLLDTKKYISQYNTAYFVVSKEFYIRPRQFLASMRFNFGASKEKTN